MYDNKMFKETFSELKASDNTLTEVMKVINSKKKPYRITRATLVAAVVVLMLSISTVALAYTGVLSSVFSAITGGTNENSGIASDTRKAVVENEYTTEISSNPATTDDGKVLELKAYYADKNELWFNFRLSNVDIPDSWDLIYTNLFSLEMIQSDGTVNQWEFISDREKNTERTTFPGGYIFSDYRNEIFENEHGNILSQDFASNSDRQTFALHAEGVVVEDGVLDITLIVFFDNTNAPIGEQARLRIGNFSFITMGDITDDNAENHWITIDGLWDYVIDIESKYTDMTELVYNIVSANEAAQYGITIHCVTVLPTVTRVVATIDYLKNELANPENANATDMPERRAKLDLLDTGVHAVAGNVRFGDMTSASTEVNGRIVDCWFEFGSVYFDAPENLTLIFTGYDGNTIEVPLSLKR